MRSNIKDNTGVSYMKIYCPHCGSTLVYHNNELYCENGDCYFGKKFERIFIEKIQSLKSKQRENVFMRLINVYCIHCGSLTYIDEEENSVCPNCGLIIEFAKLAKDMEILTVERNDSNDNTFQYKFMGNGDD